MKYLSLYISLILCIVCFKQHKQIENHKNRWKILRLDDYIFLEQQVESNRKGVRRILDIIKQEHKEYFVSMEKLNQIIEEIKQDNRK